MILIPQYADLLLNKHFWLLSMYKTVVLLNVLYIWMFCIALFRIDFMVTYILLCYLDGLSSWGLYSPSSGVPSSYSVLAITSLNLSPEQTISHHEDDIISKQQQQHGWGDQTITYRDQQDKSGCSRQGSGPFWKTHFHSEDEILRTTKQI